MTHDEEIEDLKAALRETQRAIVGMAVCFAQTLSAFDSKQREYFASTFHDWYRGLQARPRAETKEIAILFGRAFIDPAFPMSSEPESKPEPRDHTIGNYAPPQDDHE